MIYSKLRTYPVYKQNYTDEKYKYYTYQIISIKNCVSSFSCASYKNLYSRMGWSFVQMVLVLLSACTCKYLFFSQKTYTIIL